MDKNIRIEEFEALSKELIVIGGNTGSGKVNLN